MKKHKKVKVVVIITGTLLLLGLGSLAAHLLLTENLWISVNLHDEQQPQETVEIVAEIQTETPEETTQTTNNLLTPTKCTNQGITLELQLFEVGWECEIDSQPQFDAGYIKLTFDELTVTISNLGRGGPCRMGDDVVCENEDYVLSDVVNVKKYDDTFNQEIFGKLTEREDLWISIDYEDIAERDLTLEEKDSIIRILDSIKTIE